MNLLEKTLNANRKLLDLDLSILTWGNVSIRSKEERVVYIKPSGIDLSCASPEDMSLVSLEGEHLAGKKPSVDTKTHLKIYNGFEDICAVVHTHSLYATVFAQAGMDIPCFGTTHADYFYGAIPCVKMPTKKQIDDDYELQTGINIVNHFLIHNINPLQVLGAIVHGHGVFCWGTDEVCALENALVLEKIAEMSFRTLILDDNAPSLPDYILQKHFLRKHGNNKYYGQ